MEVQIFGIRNDAATRKALRFFAERRVRTHFVDLKQRAASRGELRRFVERFGVEGIMDRESRRFNSLGLAHAHLGHERWVEKLVEEPLLLRTPLVRNGDRLTVGAAEEAWRAWLTPA
jgi:arsenate reductase-like glutaredoxin family protein